MRHCQQPFSHFCGVHPARAGGIGNTGCVAKTKSSVVPKVLITIVVVVVILLLVAEFGLRWFIGNQLKSEFNQQAAEQGLTVEEDPSVSFGTYPLLLGLAQGSIKHVAVDVPETLEITYPGGAGSVPEISGTPEATIVLGELSTADMDNPVAGTFDLTTFAPDEFILATVQAEMAKATSGEDAGLAERLVQELVKITNVRSNVDAQAVEVEFTDGAARLNMRPIVLNGQLAFEVLDSQLFGIALPEDISRALTEGLQASVDQVAGGLEINSIDVVEGGLNINLVGENINVRTLESVG